jgi:predicted RNA binding protein YcfA (HicA-like mRNA interferase family)
MAGRLPVVRTKEIVRALAKEGWYVERTTSHTVLRHPDRPGSIPIPNHPRDEVARGTLRSILVATGVTPDRLRELL